MSDRESREAVTDDRCVICGHDINRMDGVKWCDACVQWVNNLEDS